MVLYDFVDQMTSFKYGLQDIAKFTATSRVDIPW